MSEVASALSEFYDEIDYFCNLFPPFTEFQWWLANLPFIGLFLVTLIPRFLICYLASFLQINPYCFLYNLFPEISLFEAISQPTYYNCNCPHCFNNQNCVPNIEKIQQFYQKYFGKCTPSVGNEIFCLIGAIILQIFGILVNFVNPIIAFLTNKVICISANPSYCFRHSPCNKSD